MSQLSNTAKAVLINQLSILAQEHQREAKRLKKVLKNQIEDRIAYISDDIANIAVSVLAGTSIVQIIISAELNAQFGMAIIPFSSIGRQPIQSLGRSKGDDMAFNIARTLVGEEEFDSITGHFYQDYYANWKPMLAYNEAASYLQERPNN